MGTITRTSKEQSNGSEAIFSKDGQIKKRINNYETTIGKNFSDNVVVFPPPVVNKIVGNQTELDVPVVDNQIDVVQSEPRQVSLRQSTTLVGFVVALTFCWSLYSLFFAVKPLSEKAELASASQSQQVEATEVSASTIVGSDKLVELKKSADQLISDSAWSDEDIHSFLNKWNYLSESEAKQVVSTAWYQLFAFNVEKHIKQEQTALKENRRNQTLLTLGLVLGVMDKGSAQKNRSESRYDKILAELTSELERADSSNTPIDVSETVLNARLKEKYAAQNQSTNNPVKVVSTSIPAKNHNRVVKINKEEIESIVNSYKRAYEHGDLASIAALFGTQDKGTHAYKQISSNFDMVFRNTKSRSMNFYSLNADITGNKAVVSSKFNSSVNFKNGKGTQFTVADINIHLSKDNDQLKISRVDIMNRHVNVVSKKNTASSRRSQSTEKNTAMPTAAELQDITTQLVTSYETGDLNQFVSLFSKEIKTNDRIDLDGVKTDYSNLFSTTSDRQMFIQNLKWDSESIGAKGTGDLEVVILSDEGSTVYSMEGKIQIVAQKIGDKVQITHLYHIEREK